MKWISLVVCIVLVLTLAKASPYNKYGRSCKDILCIVGQEECVMEQDACTTYSTQCGSYPTCKRKAGTQKRGCASIRCDAGHFCSIRQENCSRPPCEIKPVCIPFRTANTQASSTSVVNSRPSYNTYDSQRGSSSIGSGTYRGSSFGNIGQRTWSWGSG